MAFRLPATRDVPRRCRYAPPGVCSHVVNRGNDKRRIFFKDADYDLFIELLIAGKGRSAVSVFAVCAMPNHFHAVIRPEEEGALSPYMQWVTSFYATDFRARTDTRGHGHVFQRRYWNDVAHDETHLLMQLRYVEANPWRAKLVAQPEDWRWSSFSLRANPENLLLDPLPRYNSLSLSGGPLMIYGAKELAESFRTVRKNTLQIAEDIPEDKYSFRATPDVQSVGEELAHIACSPMWQQQCHAVDKKTFLAFEDFGNYIGRCMAMEKELKTKAQIVDALRANGEAFAAFLDGLSDAQLGEKVSFPPPLQPSEKTRFEMLLGVKEHEMHHRAKLMVMQRLLGMVPHLTKRRIEMQAATTSGAAR